MQIIRAKKNEIPIVRKIRSTKKKERNPNGKRIHPIKPNDRQTFRLKRLGNSKARKERCPCKRIKEVFHPQGLNIADQVESNIGQ